MPLRSCAVGHQWEVAAEETLGPGSPCPICAQQGAATLDQPRPGEALTAAFVGATQPNAAPPTQPGMPSLPGYELHRELGRGGMGVVYQARQVSLNRQVAVKMMHGGAGAGPQERARFRVEVEAVAGLHHPHIVQIFEVGEQAGMPFCSLEYLDGGTLGKKLAATRLSAMEAAEIVETLARAVHHAHQRGIIHRDLKPGNVLLTEDGTPKITDFGLAKRLGGQGVTLSGQNILGTPSYMAPEQADARKRKIGPAADVYALGATLYEMLAGRPPFQAETPLETIIKVLSEEPERPSRCRADVPADLETICMKCLRKEPGERYVSAEALADDLRRYRSGEPIQARPRTRWEKTRRWLRRQRETIAFAVGGLAVSTLLIAHFWPAGRGPEQKLAPLPGDPPKRATEEPRAELPEDLALVPQDAIVVVTASVADLLTQPGVLNLKKELEKVYPQLNAEMEKFAKEFEKETGVNPLGLTRITLAILPAEEPGSGQPAKNNPNPAFLSIKNSSTLTFLTTAKPIDRGRVGSVFKKAPEEKMHGGVTYLSGDAVEGNGKSKAMSIGFLGDRHCVQADDESVLKSYLDLGAAGIKRGPLEFGLVQARTAPLVIAAHFMDPHRKEAAAGTEPALRPLLEADSLVVAVDWVLRTAVGDSIKADFHLLFPDEAKARAGRTALLAFIQDAQKKLAEARVLFTKARDEATDKTLVPMQSILLKVVQELEFALQTAEVKLAGKQLSIQLRIRLDIAAWVAAQQEATQGSRIAVTRHRLATVGRAFWAYQEKHGRLPPAAMTSPDGKPLLSWRVALLPYFGEQKLYDAFKLDEAWDSPHNQKLLEKIPQTYRVLFAAEQPGNDTDVQVFLGPGAAFEGKEGLRLPQDFPDGASNTILAVTATKLVPWTKPEDVPYEPKGGPLPALGGDLKPAFVVLLADGSTAVVDRAISPPDLHALITRNGAEPINWKKIPVKVEAAPK